jgi:hypothetical protein
MPLLMMLGLGDIRVCQLMMTLAKKHPVIQHGDTLMIIPVDFNQLMYLKEILNTSSAFY